MSVDAGWLKDHIRAVPDFPRPGIVFRDVTPLLADVAAFRFTVDALADHAAGLAADTVVGIEARGFIVAAPVAYRLGTAFAPVRKAGKLPWQVESEEYELEYGVDRLEIHRDAITAGDRVLVVDDVVATGGTALATARLIEKLGGTVAGFVFLIELAFLDGRAKLAQYEVMSLITYD